MEIYHSPGKPRDTSFITIDNPVDDIIFSQGQFVRYPKGVKIEIKSALTGLLNLDYLVSENLGT